MCEGLQPDVTGYLQRLKALKWQVRPHLLHFTA